jgi:hypothetical protein
MVAGHIVAAAGTAGAAEEGTAEIAGIHRKEGPFRTSSSKQQDWAVVEEHHTVELEQELQRDQKDCSCCSGLR